MNVHFVNARNRAGMTQAEVARKLGVDQSSVAYWETGRNIPRPSTLVKLADLYCCTIDELFGRAACAPAACGQDSA